MNRSPSRLLCDLALLAIAGSLAPVDAPAAQIVSVDGATAVASSAPATLVFALRRSGSLAEDLQLTFHTADGTAKAGIDYTATSGVLTIPAGKDSGSIAVAVAPSGALLQPRSFQLLLERTANPAPTFAAVQTVASGISIVRSAAVADIDGDNKPDLIYWAESGLDVRLNTTLAGQAPSFDPPVAVLDAVSPQNFYQPVVVADFDGDGKPDLALMNAQDVTVLRNTTVGNAPTFDAPKAFGAFTHASSLMATDVDGDPRTDLVVGDYGSTHVAVLRNNTPPNGPLDFVQSNTETGAVSGYAGIGDLNDDGKIDVLLQKDTYIPNRGAFSVLVNRSSAAAIEFAPATDFSAPPALTRIVTADLNGDGKPDVVFTMADIAPYVSVLRNVTPAGDTVPSFDQRTQVVYAGSPYMALPIAIADVNGDARPEIILAGTSGDSVIVARNTTASGAGTFRFEPLTFAAGSTPVFIVPADIDGDGKLDLVVVDGGTSDAEGSIAVLRNTTAVDPLQLRGSPAVGTIAGDRIFADGFQGT